MPKFERSHADPKTVCSIILGGGAGTRLFPLTRRRAKPAVRILVLPYYFLLNVILALRF